MKSSVRFSQLHEGLKLEIRLSPEDLASIKADPFAEIDLREDQYSDWKRESDLAGRGEADEPNEVARIIIGVRIDDEDSD